MPFYGMLRHVALVRTDVSNERSASFIRLTKIGELGITLAVLNNRKINFVPSSPIHVTLILEAISSSKASVLKRTIRYNIPYDVILQSPS
jgi:hypothetical protein